MNASSEQELINSGARPFYFCIVFITTKISYTDPNIFLPVMNSALWTNGGGEGEFLISQFFKYLNANCWIIN